MFNCNTWYIFSFHFSVVLWWVLGWVLETFQSGIRLGGLSDTAAVTSQSLDVGTEKTMSHGSRPNVISHAPFFLFRGLHHCWTALWLNISIKTSYLDWPSLRRRMSKVQADSVWYNGGHGGGRWRLELGVWLEARCSLIDVVSRREIGKVTRN